MLGGDNEGQTYLEYMLKAIESFYHPSNYGKWSSGLLKFMNKLATQFVKRLHRERYQEPNWEPPIPKDKKLTEENVTRFVKSLIPVRFRSASTKLFGRVRAALSLVYADLLRAPNRPFRSSIYPSSRNSVVPTPLRRCTISALCDRKL